jgi:hypothetical protein
VAVWIAGVIRRSETMKLWVMVGLVILFSVEARADVGDTRIDFNVSEGRNLYVLGFLGRGDTDIGFTARQGYIYRKLTGGDIRWHDHNGAFHCGSINDARFVDDSVDQILRGLGVIK